jgi:spermidine/putrescine transport system permease protein
MLRSLRISASVTAVTVILAFPIAYFISFHVTPDRKSLWLFLITIPFWTSYLIRVFLWRVILAYDGPVNGTLLGLGIIDEPLSFILYNANAVVITLAHAFAPFAILPIFVSLEKIDRSLLEAARDLGESRAMTFLRVTLPLAMPGVLAAVLIVSIPTVGDYVTPRLVGGSGGTMIANMIYAQIFDLNDRPMGATLAVLAMAIVALTLIWGISRLRFWLWLAEAQRPLGGAGGGAGGADRDPRALRAGPGDPGCARDGSGAPGAGHAGLGRDLRDGAEGEGGDMRATPLTLFALLYLLVLYAPILLLPLFAFNDGTVIAFPLQGFTWEWFGLLLETPALHSATRNSLVIAVSVSLLATCLGLFAARAATRYRFPAKAGIMGFIMLPLVLPEVIVAISLLVVLMQLGLDSGLWSIILGHTLLCIPFSIAILQGSFSNMDQSLEEAAIDLGETPVSTFRLVTLPLVAPGIVASLLICFTISLDEFIIAFFLSGNAPTLPVYLWGQLRFPARLPMIMALGTILVILSIALLIVAETFRRRGCGARA